MELIEDSEENTDRALEFKPIHVPHDAYFRRMMADKEVAKSFLQQHLPARIQEVINFDSLEQVPDRFIPKNLRNSICDILYKVEMGHSDGYLYTLIEHQSSNDPLLPLRVWRYMTQIMEKFSIDDKLAPLVVPLVIYNGKRRFASPEVLDEVIDADPDIVKAVLGEIKPFQLIDLNKIEDEKLRNETWAGVMQFAMKHIFKEQIERHLLGFLPIIKKLVLRQTGNNEHFEALINYILNFSELENYAELSKLFRNDMLDEQGDMIMTAAYQLQKQGWEIGVEEGREELREELVINLLQNGVPVDLVAKSANMSLEEVNKISKRIL